MFKYIVIRKEIKENEFRTPLIPSDCLILIKNGYTIYVEKSKNRCYEDSMYIGCILIYDYTKLEYNKDEMLIVGLKHLDENINNIYSYKHMYFSHTFKNQTNSENILKKFKLNNGFIYDLEYFVDDNNNRLFAFGLYAGIIGTYMALSYYYTHILANMKPMSSYELLVEKISKNITESICKPSVAIIGINGRCGKGCAKLLETLNIKYTGYTKDMPKNNIIDNTIILNCINIKEYIEPFITFDTLPKNKCIIVDISCDYNNKFNPLPIYDRLSTFEEPIIKINDNTSLISIDNLPTLLPVESSIEFSNKLVNVFIGGNYKVWKNPITIYNNIKI